MKGFRVDLFRRSVRKRKSFVKSLVFLFFPMFGCLVALVVRSAMSDGARRGIEKLTDEIDWTVLGSSRVRLE